MAGEVVPVHRPQTTPHCPIYTLSPRYNITDIDILKKAKSVGIALEEVEVKQGQSKSQSSTNKSDNANISVK
jgi:hypothetical protein